MNFFSHLLPTTTEGTGIKKFYLVIFHQVNWSVVYRTSMLVITRIINHKHHNMLEFGKLAKIHKSPHTLVSFGNIISENYHGVLASIMWLIIPFKVFYPYIYLLTDKPQIGEINYWIWFWAINLPGHLIHISHLVIIHQVNCCVVL